MPSSAGIPLQRLYSNHWQIQCSHNKSLVIYGRNLVSGEKTGGEETSHNIRLLTAENPRVHTYMSTVPKVGVGQHRPGRTPICQSCPSILQSSPDSSAEAQALDAETWSWAFAPALAVSESRPRPPDARRRLLATADAETGSGRLFPVPGKPRLGRLCHDLQTN